MKLAILATVSALGLSGCQSTANLNATLNTLAQNYAHCERTLTYMVTVGPINPASGAQASGTIHCQPVDPETVVRAPEPISPVAP